MKNPSEATAAQKVTVHIERALQPATTKPIIFLAQRKPIHWTDSLITPASIQIVQRILDAKLKVKG
jgi:hypothetical protein